MGRAHTEFIQQQDLPWEPEVLCPDASPVERKTLSRDDGTGAETVLMRLPAGWRTGCLRASADAREMFVLSGKLQVLFGSKRIECASGGYLRLEAGGTMSAVRAGQATELLWLTALDSQTPERSRPEPDPFTFVDSQALRWETPWVPGPEPGLQIKLLWRCENSGAYTRLIRADAGWRELRLEHHDCIEEVYLIGGDMTMGSLGTMAAGAYIWRPAGIKHGPMRTRSGGLMFIRTDGPLVNHYTDA